MWLSTTIFMYISWIISLYCSFPTTADFSSRYSKWPVQFWIFYRNLWRLIPSLSTWCFEKTFWDVRISLSFTSKWLLFYISRTSNLDYQKREKQLSLSICKKVFELAHQSSFFMWESYFFPKSRPSKDFIRTSQVSFVSAVHYRFNLVSSPKIPVN